MRPGWIIYIDQSEKANSEKKKKTFWEGCTFSRGFPSDSAVKNPPAVRETQEMCSSIPGSGRPPGGWRGNPLQYSCLQTCMVRVAWMQSQKWLKWLSVHIRLLTLQHLRLSLLLYEHRPRGGLWFILVAAIECEMGQRQSSANRC